MITDSVQWMQQYDMYCMETAAAFLVHLGYSYHDMIVRENPSYDMWTLIHKDLCVLVNGEYKVVHRQYYTVSLDDCSITLHQEWMPNESE